MNKNWQIAQINIATALYSEEDDRISEFYSQLDDINALADTSPGFVWRLQSDSGNATDIQVGDDPMLIVNMSVWQSAEALFDFAYKSAHRLVVANRRQWFKRPDGVYQALWWVPNGHRPSVAEGMERIALLENVGPGPESFTFKSNYPCPGASGGPDDMSPEPYCSGWD